MVVPSRLLRGTDQQRAVRLGREVAAGGEDDRARDNPRGPQAQEVALDRLQRKRDSQAVQQGGVVTGGNQKSVCVDDRLWRLDCDHAVP